MFPEEAARAIAESDVKKVNTLQAAFDWYRNPQRKPRGDKYYRDVIADISDIQASGALLAFIVEYQKANFVSLLSGAAKGLTGDTIGVVAGFFRFIKSFDKSSIAKELAAREPSLSLVELIVKSDRLRFICDTDTRKMYLCTETRDEHYY